ncbi:competence/damage-inducible protein A [Niabella terrae]
MNEINASIITVGDELLIGQTIDTNSAFIGQELNKAGIWVRRRVAVGDVYEDMWQALDEEVRQSRLIIITGGLGPTADDLTKPLLSDYFKAPLVRNHQVLAHLEDLFRNVYKREGPLPEIQQQQADLPQGCTVLHNAHGTAAGMWLERTDNQGQKTVVVSLPGVPYEMKKIVTDELMPRLSAGFGGFQVVHKVLSTFGMGESSVAARLEDFEKALPAHIRLAYLPGYGMVKLRLTGKGTERSLLEMEMETHFQTMKTLLAAIIIAENDDPLEVIVGKILKEQGKSMASAESCTGGLIAHLVTSIPGSSDYYKGTVVAYSNEIKEQVLGVDPQVLKTVGAVSETTAQQMVQGAIRTMGTDYAVATSGIMGPGGGSEAKPVGTVWIAAGSKESIRTKQLHLGFDRTRNIQTTALHTLNLLRRLMLGEQLP